MIRTNNSNITHHYVDRNYLDALRATPIGKVADALLEKGAGSRAYYTPQGERTASLMLFPTTNSFYDYSAKCGGSVFDLVMHVRDVEFEEARRWLEAFTGVTQDRVPARPTRPAPKQVARSKHLPNWQAIISAFVAESHAALFRINPSAQSAYDYLKKERGLSEETIRKAKLGFNAEERDYFIGGERVYVPKGIVIPAYENGRIAYVKIRTDNPSHRYHNLKGSRTNVLYSVQRDFREAREIILTEGEFDCLSLQQAMPEACVLALPGATVDVGRVADFDIRDYQRVITIFDNDKAGQSATANIRKKAGARHIACKVPYPHKDVNAWLSSGGTLDQLQRMRNPVRFTSGLPDSWRCVLNVLFPTSVVVLMEMLIAGENARLLDLEDFTSEDVLALQSELGITLPERTLHRAFEILEEQGFLPFLHTNKDSFLMSKEQSAKMALIRRGRKAKRYTLETHDELVRLMRGRLPIRLREKHYPNGTLTEATERMLRDIGIDPKLADAINRKYQESGGVAEEDWLVMRRFKNLSAALEDNLHCSPLPPWEIRNGSDYNAAFMHAIKRSYPDENLSRREWAQRLGTGTRVISELQKRAGILTEEQYCIVPLKLKGDLKQQVRKAESENRGYCHYLSAQIGGREERIGLESPHLERWLRAVRASKATVQAVMQVVNRQWIESDEKPEVAQRPSAERKPADSRRARPQVEQEFGARYDRNWLFEQFSQGVRQVCGYRVNHDFVLNPATGEVLHQHPTSAQLADLILAQPADNAPIKDDFILWIEQEFGGRVREA